MNPEGVRAGAGPYGSVRESRISECNPIATLAQEGRVCSSDGVEPTRSQVREDSPCMLTFFVAGQANLFADLVCALVQAALPEATVTLDPTSPADPRGVRISLESTGRWLFVSTGRGPDTHAAEALSNGATAALSLDSRAEDFQRALDALIRGDGHYVSAEMVQWMASMTLRKESHGTPDGPAVHLTSRERQVLYLVAGGLSNIEIGQVLTISTNTVRSHLHALSVKLEATSRTRMLANARALGLPEANGHPAEANGHKLGSQRSA